MASANLHRLGFFPSYNRQRTNEALNSFLMTLRFLQENDMDKLFSCENCEKKLPNGDIILDGIVTDGTAEGILGKLPEFERITCEIDPVRQVPDRQYIMRNAKYRNFVDAILIAARVNQMRLLFQVLLRPTLW